jgi:NAD(P)-dependent dehydrogenase (short-subunit alcohol dehydrogenase family)
MSSMRIAIPSTPVKILPHVMLLALAVLPGVAGALDAEAQEAEAAGASPTVLITGANRGLGLEFARQYAAAGWAVIGTARQPDTATELEELDVRVLQLDVTDAASIARMVRDLDGRPIDLLINNAGIFPRVSTLDEVDFSDVARTLEVNTVGPMKVTRALLPHLRAGSGKRIVSITSGLGSIANNTSGRFYGYRESKAALNMFTRSLAVELEDEGFTCVVMSPGWVRTDMGGPNANLAPSESIAGMRKVIAGLTPADTGTYWNYDGEQLPW